MKVSGQGVRKTVPVKKKVPGDDEDPAYDGSEPGSGFEFGQSNVSASDRAIASSYQRGGPRTVDDAETHPITPLQKTVTVGKEMAVSRTCEYPDSMEGMCTSFNTSYDTLAVGTRNSRIMLIDPHTAGVMNTIDLSNGKSIPPAITSVRFRKDVKEAQNVMLVAQGSEVHHVHASTGTVLSSIIEKGNEILSLDVRSDGQVSLQCGSDKASTRCIFTMIPGSYRFRSPLQIYDLAASKLRTILPFHQPSTDSCLLYAAKFGVDKLSKYVFAGGSGTHPCAKMFQRSGEVIGTLALKDSVHAMDVAGLPDHKTVAICCATKMYFYDVKV
eukprot:gene5868-6159_t